MNREIGAQAFTLILVIVLQALIFKQLAEWVAGTYPVHVFIYPLFILFLPLSTPNYLVLLLGFLIGFCVDIFYFSFGVHTSASVFTAFIRVVYLEYFKPQARYEGEKIKFRDVDWPWIARYTSLLYFLHILWYFSVEFFSFALISQVLIHTLFSFLASLIFVSLFLMIFKPRG